MRRPGVRDPARAPAGVALAALTVLGACRPDAPLVVTEPPAPELTAVRVDASPTNVLSAVVAAYVVFTDSAVVRFAPDGDALDSLTPAATPLGDSVVMPVLGLLPATRYAMRVTAYGAAGGETVSDTLWFDTGTVPSDLPSYVASGADPSPGYVVFAAAGYGVVIDNTGRVVWYVRPPGGTGLNFQPQTGRYYYRRPPTDPTDATPWVELDVLGRVTRTVGCARGLVPRFHDLIVESDGSYWLLCDETRVMDLTGVGGVAAARVIGTVVQHLADDGTVLFEWSPFDHFAITDVDFAARSGELVNWTHGNSLARCENGDLLVSFRNLGEVTRIDTRTGDVVWRMGGLANEFTFQNTPVPAFARQHSARVSGPDEVVMLDNLGDPVASFVERYRYDARARTVTLVASYGATPEARTDVGGSVQALPVGRTLASFGRAGRVEEYDAAGALVWQIEGNAGYVFRAERIRSLYRPGVN